MYVTVQAIASNSRAFGKIKFSRKAENRENEQFRNQNHIKTTEMVPGQYV